MTPRPRARPARRPQPAAEPGRQPRPAPAPPPKPAPAPAREDFSIASCDCEDCRAACLNAPGWFTPVQIPRLARHLGLSVEETFRRHLAIGVTRLDDGSERLGVLPHKLRDGKKPGSRWTLAEIATPGRCVFYDRGRCAIYPVRPDECARMMHDRGDRTRRIRRRMARRHAKVKGPFTLRSSFCTEESGSCPTPPLISVASAACCRLWPCC
jgi:Fe-S-cluster containining protein